MKKVIIIPNSTKDKGLSVTYEIEQKLASLGIEAFIDAEYSEELGTVPYSGVPDDAQLIIVVGGDGSVIDASGLAVSLDIPILGVNLGRVGYLTEVERDSLEVLSRLVKGEYHIEERMLLSVEKISENGEALSCPRLAVNDAVISHENYFGISDLRVENEKGDAIRYRADGVIVSTPLGSTAYALSAGGPVIAHSLDSLTVTPVCPHSLFNRSIIFDPEETVKVHNSKEAPLNISVDGRLFTELYRGELCRIKRSEKRLKVLSFDKNNMFSTLFKKIKDMEE